MVVYVCVYIYVCVCTVLIFIINLDVFNVWPQILSPDLIQMDRVRNVLTSDFMEYLQNHYYNYSFLNNGNEMER